MKVWVLEMIFIIECFLLLAAGGVRADVPDESYDYSASIDCLPEPLAPQYGGGMVRNPTLDSGLDGWAVFSRGKIEQRVSKSGNKYLVAYNRSQAFDSFTQVVPLQNSTLYTFSAWMQINNGKEIISAALRTPSAETIIIGSVIATSGCWSMIKGGFQADQNMNATLYFQSNNTQVEFWLDNVSLKPFSRDQWNNQRLQGIDRVRKKVVKIHVTDKDGNRIRGAQITINETKPRFLLGCGSTEAIITNKAYQDWFIDRFTATAFDNEMKWYYTEKLQGIENYTVPDAMVAFFEKNGISIRGHTILWNDGTFTQPWVKNLSLGETVLPHRAVWDAAVRRTGSVVTRYAGKVIAWDVMNENIHHSFYEDEIGPNASALFYQIARALDPNAQLFLNEYNTLEHSTDLRAIPSVYVEKIKEIRSFPGNENMVIGIGLQGHFGITSDVSLMRSLLDVLGATKMPIWLTELDIRRGPNQATQLEDIMREAFSHPAVQGIIVWGGWKPTACSQACLSTDESFTVKPGCAQMCLTDNSFRNLPTGDVVDKLIKEWRTSSAVGFTDSKGFFKTNVFQGEYSLTVSHPEIPSVVNQKIVVIDESPQPLYLAVSL